MNAFWSLSIYANSIMATVNLPQDFKEFLRLLNGHNVEYLLITGISGVTFRDCYPEKVTDEIDGVEVVVIGLDVLKVNKRAAGRHKDLDDLENLP
jgi:hypothetical protein